MNADGMIKTVLCARDSNHLVTVHKDLRTLLVSAIEKKNADTAIRALAGRIICSACSNELSHLGVEVVYIIPNKCADTTCTEWVLFEKRCAKHETLHQAGLAQKRLERDVVKVRLAFVAAYGLRPLVGVLVGIIRDAEAAEEKKNLEDALGFYKQALRVWNDWQEARVETPANKTGMSRAERRAARFNADGNHQIAKELRPEFVKVVALAPEPIAEPVFEEPVLQIWYDVLKSTDELGRRLEVLEVATKGDTELAPMVEAAQNLYLKCNYDGAEALRREIETRINAPVLVAA